jgi:hypothetical protein
MDECRNREIYRQSLEMNRDAFADGEYGIAYHALLLALECAQKLQDLEHVSDVIRLADKQSRFIDDHHPEHMYSSKASQRGNIGLFQTAAQKARILMLAMKNWNAEEQTTGK